MYPHPNPVRWLLTAVAMALLGSGCGLQDQSDKPEAQAGIKAATDWLGQVDAGDYSGSWSNAAAYFRAAVPSADWVNSLAAFRTPMGAMTARTIKTARLATTMPGAPDGHYVLIQFDAAFANKKSAVETATVMLETTGVWRVSGYFIR